MATRIELQNEIAFTSSTQLMPLIKSSAKHPLHSKTDEIVRSATCSALSQCSLQVSLEYGDGEMQHVPENSFGRKKRETWQLAFKHLFKVFESFYVEGYLGENNASGKLCDCDFKVKVGVLRPIQQPVSYWERPSNQHRGDSLPLHTKLANPQRPSRTSISQ